MAALHTIVMSLAAVISQSQILGCKYYAAKPGQDQPAYLLGKSVINDPGPWIKYLD